MEDLTAHDSQLLDVASVEGIDVAQKLALAQDELALELDALLTRLSYVDQLFWLAPQPGLGSVVVTPALKLWHTFRSLEMVYSDAYNNQLNDRYAGKRDQFHVRAKWAYETLVAAGIGVASVPVPQAATPAVTAAAAPAPGTPLPVGTYYVTVAWVNAGAKTGRAPYRPPSQPRGARCWSSRQTHRQEPRRDGTSMWAPVPIRWRCKTDRPSPSGRRGCSRRPWRRGGLRERGNVPVI
jgi:hypothetical protein